MLAFHPAQTTMNPNHGEYIMARTITIAVLRLLTTATAILMSLAAFTLFIAVLASGQWFTAFFALLPTVFAAYFVYAAYLVWFRLSPLAIQHVCGTLAFVAYVLITSFFSADESGALENEWRGAIYLGTLVVVYIVYRITHVRLGRWLCPSADHETDVAPAH
jgi:hypothetical protein